VHLKRFKRIAERVRFLREAQKKGSRSSPAASIRKDVGLSDAHPAHDVVAFQAPP